MRRRASSGGVFKNMDRVIQRLTLSQNGYRTRFSAPSREDGVVFFRLSERLWRHAT
ncbi:hypothetical protein AGMMS49546_30030 [Spirochaetia bacterium]|nr:hypothetical protein AGMMS49546_30030 [Spirochaetia bacterium]